MILHEIIVFLFNYAAYIIGIIIQLIFIFLPTNLKNWEDDLLNVVTYMGIQGLVFGVIFICVPWVFSLKIISAWVLLFIFFSIFVISFIRVIKSIPLEFTSPITIKIGVTKKFAFKEFLTAERRSALIQIDFQTAEGEARYNAFRERLLRKKVENEATILEQLIETETVR